MKLTFPGNFQENSRSLRIGTQISWGCYGALTLLGIKICNFVQKNNTCYVLKQILLCVPYKFVILSFVDSFIRLSYAGRRLKKEVIRYKCQEDGVHTLTCSVFGERIFYKPNRISISLPDRPYTCLVLQFILYNNNTITINI